MSRIKSLTKHLHSRYLAVMLVFWGTIQHAFAAGPMHPKSQTSKFQAWIVILKIQWKFFGL